MGVERQVQIKGSDAKALSQFLTPRNIKKCAKGQAMYAPFLDFKGGFINDPVMLKIDDHCYWFSLAAGCNTKGRSRRSTWVSSAHANCSRHVQ